VREESVVVVVVVVVVFESTPGEDVEECERTGSLVEELVDELRG
jgi:hypothetical protein